MKMIILEADELNESDLRTAVQAVFGLQQKRQQSPRNVRRLSA